MNSFKVLMQYASILLHLLRLLRKHSKKTMLEKFRHARHGSIKPTDALILARLINRYKPQRILEIGSFLGVSTRFLLDVSSGWSAQVTAVDPNIPHRVFDNPRKFLLELNSAHIPRRLEIVTAFFGKPSQRIDGPISVVDEDWSRKFDFIFIDGDHSYESVMENFRISLTMLENGGCIVFHDALSWSGVESALGDIACSFRGTAKVEILGKGDRRLLRLVGMANDGIGVFRLAENCRGSE